MNVGVRDRPVRRVQTPARRPTRRWIGCHDLEAHASRVGPASMQLSDFDVRRCPPNCIAQQPVEPRDAARLLLMRPGRPIDSNTHAVRDLPELLGAGDLLVANRSRVLPARILGRLAGGGRAELLLLRQLGRPWETLARPARRLRPGDLVTVAPGLGATRGVGPTACATFAGQESKAPMSMPRCWPTASCRCRPISAGGSATPSATRPSSPTPRARPPRRRPACTSLRRSAGPSGRPWRRLRDAGPARRPGHVSANHRGRSAHAPHASRVVHRASGDCAADRRRASAGGRVVAVGTTSVRALETWAASGEPEGWTELFILPGAPLRVVDGLHDQLSPARVDAADAGQRLRRPRTSAGRVCRGYARRSIASTASATRC